MTKRFLHTVVEAPDIHSAMHGKVRLIIQEVIRHRSLSFGLLNGLAGEALFLYTASSACKHPEWEEEAFSRLEQALKHLEEQPAAPMTYCSGIAGLGWTLDYLHRRGHIEDAAEILEGFDGILLSAMDAFTASHNWDLLHGAAGVGVYFAGRASKSAVAAEGVSRLLTYLAQRAEASREGRLRWRSRDAIRERDVYNISLSHGIAGIASFLLRASKMEGCRERSTALLTGAVHYILSQEMERDRHGCYFPNYSLESDVLPGPSRLGWCYGDLGIASVLYQSGVALHRQEWADKAIEVFRYAALQRRDTVPNRVHDAGLCHGSTGIGTIFYRMWWHTKLPEFRAAAGYWFAVSLQLGSVPDGILGFKPFTNSGTVQTPDLYSFLEGISGIGIAMVTYLYGLEPAWDECLLISH